MLLTLDIGNTNIKSAFFEANRLFDFKVHSDLDEVIEYINQTDFDEAAVCSVNPDSQNILLNKIKNRRSTVFLANVRQKLNLSVSYKTPDTLGMDRVCSAVGALEIATEKKIISDNQYLITIDFGTATTINIVSPDKQFVGGLISPGIKTMLKSLTQNTAQLPLTDPQSYNGIIGETTESSIISGVLTATIGMINETINELKSKSKKYPIIFVTGGNSKFILPYIKYEVHFEEALVLKGLKIIYDLNK